MPAERFKGWLKAATTDSGRRLQPIADEVSKAFLTDLCGVLLDALHGKGAWGPDELGPILRALATARRDRIRGRLELALLNTKHLTPAADSAQSSARRGMEQSGSSPGS